MDIEMVIFLGLLAAGAFIISILSFRRKGILFNILWLYIPKEDRQQMDKSPYYADSGVWFLLFGLIFSLACLKVAFQIDWLMYAIYSLAAIIVIYAIISAMKL